jgi:metal dependent phosphohydrolase
MNREVYKALQFSQKAHEGQVDKSGVQYFLHPVRVSYLALTDDEKIVALLHDVLEDTHYTVEDIKREVTNNDFIIQALELLNHDKSVPYFDYIRKIRDSKNCLAINVKKYDIADNTDPNRGKVYNREKYSAALSILNHELN